LDRADGVKTYDRDTPITEVGKLGSLEIGYALAAAGLTTHKFQNLIYCGPSAACVETAHYICRGIALYLAGNQPPPANDGILLRIEHGLTAQIGGESRLTPRNMPTWLTADEIERGLGREVDTTYKSAVTDLPMESIEEYYAR
jgi:hypothetical protein